MTNPTREEPKSESRPYEQYSEKTGYPVVKKPRNKIDMKSLQVSEIPWAWVCVACLVLALIVVVLFPVFQDKHKAQTILALEKRVAGLERRLEQYPGESILNQRTDSLETSINELRQRLIRQERKLSDSLERIKTAAPVDKKERSPKEEKVVSAGTTAPIYHDVEPGETLYRISRRYGVSVDVLRQLNGLSDSSLIHPGQKLIVSAP